MKNWKITNFYVFKKTIAKILKNLWFSRIFKIRKIHIIDLWLHLIKNWYNVVS